jgi:predicted nuclease with TOPRIM domain
MKAVITVTCPECKGTLDIDVSRQRVLSHKAPLADGEVEKDKSELFDEVVDRVRKKRSDAEEKFERAQQEAKQNRERLDSLFGEFQEKVDEEKKKGPSETDENLRDLFWD